MPPLIVPGLLAVLALAGCESGTVAGVLGMERRAPDEFQVVRQAPLAMPPDFNLRPPDTGAPRPQTGTTAQAARSALTGSAGGGALVASAEAGAGELTGGEQALLASVPVQSDPSIREELMAAADQVPDQPQTWFGDIFGFASRGGGQPGEPLDARAEAARLRVGTDDTGGSMPTLSAAEPVPIEAGVAPPSSGERFRVRLDPPDPAS